MTHTNHPCDPHPAERRRDSDQVHAARLNLAAVNEQLRRHAALIRSQLLPATEPDAAGVYTITAVPNERTD